MKPHFITDCQLINREMEVVIEGNSNIIVGCFLTAFLLLFLNLFNRHTVVFYLIYFHHSLKFNWTTFSPYTFYSPTPHAPTFPPAEMKEDK